MTHNCNGALCGSNGTLRNICNEPVEFKLSLDHGLKMEMSETGLQDPIMYYYRYTE